MTLLYIQRHIDPEAQSITVEPRMVVIHWTGTPDLESAFRIFDEERAPRERWLLYQAGAVNVSAHFLIDRDGSIYRLMPETILARHCIGLNHLAIGIENVGGPESPLTAGQLAANAALVRDLKRRFPQIETLIGHHEHNQLRTSSLFREREPGYRTEKIDPGENFMRALRVRLKDLGLSDARSRTR